MSKKLIVFALLAGCILTAACAKSHSRQKETPPCTVGINEKSCQLDVKGASVWSRTSNVLKGGEGRDKNDIVKKIYLMQEFTAGSDGRALWRRTSTVVQDGMEAQTMFLQGRVEKVEAESLRLTIEKSSCDGIDKSFHIEKGGPLYYQRTGTSLTLQSQPFIKVTTSGSGLGAVLGAAIAASVGTVMQATVTAIFDLTLSMVTFGTLRDQLADGQGQYQAGRRGLIGTTPANFSYGKLGCFLGRRGEAGEFKASEIQSFDW